MSHPHENPAVRTARPRRLSRRFRPEAVAGPPAFDAGSALALMAWSGLATGLVEVGILLAQHALVASSTLGSLQMNRHFLWMIPASQLVLFLAAGLPAAAVAAVRPGAGRWLAARCAVGLASLSLLLTVRGLIPVAAAVLALGLAARLGALVDRRHAHLRRFVRVSLPILGAVAAGLGGVSYHRTVLAERRALAALPPATPGAPNVLLLVLDTVRADRLSLHGADRATTPNLARLARRGVVFDEAISPAPWTFPSHASMLTGRWPHELNITGDRPLDGTFPTLAGYLADRGYATAGFVANTYYCNSWFGLDRGFAHYEDYYEANLAVSPLEALRCSALGRELIERSGTDANARVGSTNARKDAARINAAFLRWLDREDVAGRPFFAFLNAFDAHDPYVPPEGFDQSPGLKPEGPADLAAIQGWHDRDKTAITPRDLDLVRDAYDACLISLDRQLGLLFDDLDRRGVLDDTLVIVTSDHGEAFGEHGLYLHGQSLYRPEVRVPLLVFGPGRVPADRRFPAPVSLRDLPATVVERLGLADGSPFPGRSLARFWETGLADGPEEPVLSEAAIRTKVARNPKLPPAHRGPMASITLDGFTLIRDAVGREELYDHAADPDEAVNLAGSPEHRDRLERLRAELDRQVPKP